MNPIYIEATTLSDAWFQALYRCLEHGNIFKIDRGSYAGDKRLEFDYITIRIKNPDKGDLLPKLPGHYNLPDPVDQDYLDGYISYLMTDEVSENESYTYGQRLTNVSTNPMYIEFFFGMKEDILIQDKEIWEYDEGYLNQIEALIWTYKNKGYRNNQMVLQVAQPTDMVLQDPPCLRHIDTRIQDNTLHFFPYFRSWDLWGGFPANLAAIEYLKQYVAAEIGVKNGEIIAASKGLHLYSYVWELAECLRGKTIEEFKKGL